MKKNLIFDADGVLLLSTKVGINTLLKAITTCGLNAPSFEDVRRIWGRRLESELIPLISQQCSWPEGNVKKVAETFLSLADSTVYPQQAKLVETLEFLSGRYRLGIASNRDSHSLSWRLRQHGIDEKLFHHIQTADSGVSKPDPRIFEKFWNGVGFNPLETLYIGDSIEHDLEAARRHDPPLSFVAITSGLHSMGEFIRAGVKVTHIFKSVIELPEALIFI